MDVTKLRAMISRPCENAFRVPSTTSKYTDVLKWWSFYKQGKLSRDITLLNSIFSFRRQSSDHVILYSSSAINPTLSVYNQKEDREARGRVSTLSVIGASLSFFGTRRFDRQVCWRVPVTSRSQPVLSFVSQVPACAQTRCQMQTFHWFLPTGSSGN